MNSAEYFQKITDRASNASEKYPTSL